MHKPEMVLVVGGDGRRAPRFEKSLLGIRETPWVFRVPGDLERYFKDILVVFTWAWGTTEEEDSQLCECSEMLGEEILPGGNWIIYGEMNE